MTAILMVCLGNICRSPMAEAAMRCEVQKAKLNIVVDSAGTAAWHIGKAPDERGQQVVMQRAGIDMQHYKARQVNEGDFRGYDYIFAMDEQNLRDLQNIRPANSKAKLGLMLQNNADSLSVADPYYGNIADFETVWDQVSTASAAFIQTIQSYDR